MGMPTCKFHGSGGERYRQLGQIRYLAWLIVGNPGIVREMPAEEAARISMAVFAEWIFTGSGSKDPKMIKLQIEAATLMTGLINDT